jgi:hypothetical protein
MSVSNQHCGYALPCLRSKKDPFGWYDYLDCDMRFHIPQSREAVYQGLGAYLSQDMRGLRWGLIPQSIF